MDWNDIKKNPIALICYGLLALLYIAMLIGICLV